MTDDYADAENALLDEIERMKQALRLVTGDASPVTEIRVSPTVGRAMGIPPGTAAVYSDVIVHADAEISRPEDRSASVGYASSMADLADIGAELFDRLASVAVDMVPRGTWNDQPQHVRDGICILFSMIRNRATAEMQMLLRAERLAKERTDG